MRYWNKERELHMTGNLLIDFKADANELKACMAWNIIKHSKIDSLLQMGRSAMISRLGNEYGLSPFTYQYS